MIPEGEGLLKGRGGALIMALKGDETLVELGERGESLGVRISLWTIEK